jgi:LuxR family maltose regulon positive regulatory protein
MTAMIGDSSSSAHGRGKRSARSAGERRSGEIRDVVALPRLAQADRQAATTVLMPLLDIPQAHRVWVAAAFLLGAIARDALGDPDAAGRALQHALDLAEPDQGLFPFLSHPPPTPPDRQERHPSADGNLICQTTDVLAGGDRPVSPPPPQTRHPETLTHGETRVLRYLPTNLTAREIAGELYLSVNTVKTHQRHLYQKLGARSRTEAVGQARALGLLASSPRGSDRKPEDRHVLKSQAFRRTESLVPPLQSPRLPNSTVRPRR